MSKIKSILEYISHVREKSKELNKNGLYIAFALIGFYALVMSIVCFVGGDAIMGIVNMIISLFMIFTIIIFARIKSATFLSVSVVIFIYALMMFFLFEGGVGGISIMWLLSVPMAGMALISLFYGAILSILIGISVPLYMLTPLHRLGYQYSEDHRIRFPIIYWAFLIIALVIFIRIDRAEEKQKELIRNADESNRSKSEFLANMSHEIRTPLNAIMGMCELNMNEDISDIVRENSENILSSGKNLINIVNDLLDFSKIESGRMEVVCREYRLSDVLNDVTYMTVARKGSKNLEFTVDCDPDIPDLLYGDEMRIKQIMINLLTNAIKYTKRGGFLLTITYRKESYGINLIITVKDSGIGIKKENIGRIFDAYGRVDAEKTHSIEGTGLGLPITRELVRLMNGIISVESKYRLGTEFKVVIPQGVVDETPIVKLENAENINILYHYAIDNMSPFAVQYTINAFRTLLKKVKTKRYMCRNLNDLKAKVLTNSYTHIVLGKSEYLEDKEYFNELSKNYPITVIQERNNYVPVGGKIVNSYKPFYTRKLSDFINSQAQTDKNKNSDNFTAPNANILIVDDNAVNLKIATGLMKPHKMNIDTAENGAAAIKLITRKQYDLVFMDHLMPEMNGIETYRKIRQLNNDYADKIPFIALTANASSDVRELFAAEGFCDFISKPVQTAVLNSMLLKWLPESLIISEKECDE